jgi:DNA polymerase-1
MSNRRHPWANCSGCPLNQFGSKYVGSSGPAYTDGRAGIDGASVEVIVVGEAPGVEEVVHRKPFIGPSGQLMRSALLAAGYDPEKAFYTNSVCCRPPDNDLASYSEAVEHCRPRLERELALVGDASTPILAVGAWGALATLGATQGAQAPKKVAITRQRGKQFAPVMGAPVQKHAMLTVHPAYVLRANAMLSTFEQDVWVLRHGAPVHPLQRAPDWVEPVNVEDLRALLACIPDGAWIAFDVETSNVRWYSTPHAGYGQSDLLMLGIYWSDRAPAIIVNEHLLRDWNAREALDELFERVRTCAHNGKFDVLFLQRDGVYKARTDFDTMIAHYAIQENPPHGLKELASLYFYVKDYEAELVAPYFKGIKQVDRDYRTVPHDELAQYLAWDCACTFHLRQRFERLLQDDNMLLWPFYNLLMPLSHALLTTERDGIGVDRPYLEQQHNVIAADIEASVKALRKLSGNPTLNPNSWQQVGKLLWAKHKFKPSTHYTDGSTSIAALQAAGIVYVNTDNKFDSDDPFVRGLLHYRRLRKTQSTYIVGILNRLDANDRVHPRYVETASETGRLGARDPAIQTIPRSYGDYFGAMLRSAFVADPPGASVTVELGRNKTPHVPALIRPRKFVMADYSQAELRVWAHLTQDPYLLAVYREGRDLHNENSIRLYGHGYTKEQRTQMKNWVFAFVYGGDAFSFASQAKLPVSEASAMVAEFEKLVPVAIAWRDRSWWAARKLGYVQTVFGRKRRFPIITLENEREIKHAVWNAPIQSTAADLTNMAHIMLWRQGYKIVLTMHDMLCIECYADQVEDVSKVLGQAMVEIGEQWVPSVPWAVDVSVVDRWSDMPPLTDRPDISDILGTEDTTEETQQLVLS